MVHLFAVSNMCSADFGGCRSDVSPQSANGKQPDEADEYRMRELAEEEDCADISARAEFSALLWAHDPELLHLGLKGGAFHSEPRCGTGRTADNPIGVPQRFHNMLPLGIFQRFW